jgi:hypothetical protein
LPEAAAQCHPEFFADRPIATTLDGSSRIGETAARAASDFTAQGRGYVG